MYGVPHGVLQPPMYTPTLFTCFLLTGTWPAKDLTEHRLALHRTQASGNIQHGGHPLEFCQLTIITKQ